MLHIVLLIDIEMATLLHSIGLIILLKLIALMRRRREGTILKFYLIFGFNVNNSDAQEARRNAELRSVSERLESVEMALQDRVRCG